MSRNAATAGRFELWARRRILRGFPATLPVEMGATSYNAWLSDQNFNVTGTMEHDAGPYVLTTGVTVAANRDELASGALRHAIDCDENKTSQSGNVWTGSTSDGMGTTADWQDRFASDRSETGTVGDASVATTAWTDTGGPALSRDNQPRMDCIQQGS